MKLQSLFCVLSCLCLFLLSGTAASPPGKKPLQDKDAEVKELIAERERLRQRLEEIDKRLGVPVLVHMALNRRDPVPRGEFVELYASLSTDRKNWQFVSAGEIFKNEPFRFEVEFPHEDAKQAPLRVPGSATESYKGSHEMEAEIRVPKGARLGVVAIKVSWPTSQRIAQGSTTLKVRILPVK